MLLKCICGPFAMLPDMEMALNIDYHNIIERY